MLYTAVGKDNWKQACATKFQERIQEVTQIVLRVFSLLVKL